MQTLYNVKVPIYLALHHSERESSLQRMPVGSVGRRSTTSPRERSPQRERYDGYVVVNQKPEEFSSATRVVSATAELHLNKKRAKMQKMEEEMAAALAAR